MIELVGSLLNLRAADPARDGVGPGENEMAFASGLIECDGEINEWAVVLLSYLKKLLKDLPIPTTSGSNTTPNSKGEAPV